MAGTGIFCYFCGMELEIERTADGSPTLYRRDIDEHYHSVKGAIAEGRHVYVDAGWREAAASGHRPVRVLEIGFGTGLNAALTARAAREEAVATEYFSVELYPLPADTLAGFAPWVDEDVRGDFQAVNVARWGEPEWINERFVLTKIEGDLLTMELPEGISAVYFDAFAPEKQPEMWDEAVFRKIFRAMAPGGVLTTYCAKGRVRRMLNEIGFVTERLPGPPGGKREILRAVRK